MNAKTLIAAVRASTTESVGLMPIYRGQVLWLCDELERLDALLNAPEIEDFDKALPLEAAHQVERWGPEHDASKEPEMWYWVVGHLAGKALHAMRLGQFAKAKHHTISTAAVLRNWHAQLRARST